MADSKDGWLWREQRQSVSEGIIEKVKGDDAEWQHTKQRQRMANHRACETGKQRYQQVISIIGSLLSVNIFCFRLSNFKLSTSSFTHHPRVTKARATLHAHVRTLTQLAMQGFWVNLHLVLSDNIAVATLYFETQGHRNRGGHRGQLQQAVVNKLLSLTTSLSVESDNAQLLHMLLVLEHELTSGVRYLDNSNISLTVN